MMDEEQISSLIDKYLPLVAEQIGAATAKTLAATQRSESTGEPLGSSEGSGFSTRQEAPSQTTGAAPSGSRSGSSSLGEQSVPPFSPRQVGGLRGLLGRPDEESQRLIDERVRKHQERRSGADGFLPSYFGGQITWQQIAQSATDVGESFYKRGDSSSLSRMGNLMQSVGSFAEENALAIESGIHFAQRLNARSRGLEAFGENLGTPAGGVGPFGSGEIGPARLPFVNPQAMTGITATFDSTLSAALSAGLTASDDKGIKTALADLGFFDGEEDTKRLLGSADGSTRSGLRELFQHDRRAFGQQAEMVVKATRYGTTDVESMVEMMKGVGDAAKAANVGLEDMLAQMDAAGEAAKDAGGKYKEGAEAAKEFSQMSGLPAEGYNKLLGSPMMEGLISGQTGLPPYLQGAIDAGPKNELFMQSMEQIISTVPEPPVTDEMRALGISGADARAGMIREMLGVDIDPSFIKKFFNPSFRNNFQQYSKVDKAIDSYDKASSAKGFQRTTKRIKKAIAGAKNLSGSRLYSEKDIEGLREAENEARRIVSGEFGQNDSSSEELVKFVEEAKGIEKGGDLLGLGESNEEFLNKHLNKRLKAKYIAEKTREEAKNIYKRKGEEKVGEYNNQIKSNVNETSEGSSNVTVTVDFTGEAKRMLKQVNVKKQNNGRANAGGPPRVQTQNGPEGATAAD